MKENYAPWAIDIGAFPEKGSVNEQLKFLLGFAILAPSGHNSQPWEFKIKNNSIEFWANKDRSLGKSDPEGRQTLISLGCALENLLIAADYYGYKTETKYFPENDSSLIVSVYFEKPGATKNNPNHLIFSIPKRASNRGEYTNQTLPEKFLGEVKEINSDDIEIVIVTEKSKISSLAEIATQAQIEVMDKDSFREELSHYIESSFTKSKTGMPGFTLGLPSLISLFASKLIKKVNMSRLTAKKDDALLKKFTTALLLISAKNDDKYSWVKTGQVFERIWLIATQNEVSFSVLAAGVQVGEYYKKIQEILKTNLRPLAFSRVGYPKKVARHSPRLNISEVVK